MPVVGPSKAHRTKSAAPQLLELPPLRVVTVHTTGDPNEVGPRVIPALYGAAFTLKFQRRKEGADFKVGTLRARWSSLRLGDDGEVKVTGPLEGDWALPIAEGTRTADLAQKVPGVPVRAESWHYGTVAQVLHVGSYAAEAPTIRRLHDFIEEQGYEVAGPHEEEYLTRPDAKVVKTIIRYPVRRKRAAAWLRRVAGSGRSVGCDAAVTKAQPA